jgi:hexosaminidase
VVFDFDIHRAVTGNISSDCEISARYSAQGWNSLIDGFKGNPVQLENNWIGIKGQDCQVLLELERNMDIQEIAINFLQDKPKWIYFPSSVSILSSQDGNTYTNIADISDFGLEKGSFSVEITNKIHNVRFLKFEINNFGKIPENMPGADHLAWFFVDEITVR